MKSGQGKGKSEEICFFYGEVNAVTDSANCILKAKFDIMISTGIMEIGYVFM